MLFPKFLHDVSRFSLAEFCTKLTQVSLEIVDTAGSDRCYYCSCNNMLYCMYFACSLQGNYVFLVTVM